MTMVTCKECKGQVSSMADACLHCGARKRGTRRYATVAVVLLGASLLANSWMLGRLQQAELRAAAGGIAQAGERPG